MFLDTHKGKRVVLDAKGNPVKLNQREALVANSLQKLANSSLVKNALGFEVDITTLTSISKVVSEQKHFQIAPANYLPIRVGADGAGQFATRITTYRTFDVAGEFEEGYVNTGANDGRLAVADAAVDSLDVRVMPWAKEILWTLFELGEATASGNWDLVTTREKARKKNWDLGIQRVAFLGANGLNAGANGTVLGLLNQRGVRVSNLINKPISTMSEAELKLICALLIEEYRVNCERTAWPTHFIVPESDYNGLASQSSPTFPIKSVKAVLEETFREITQNPNFKILPLAYADVAHSGGVLSANRYCLSNYDEESIRMDIPMDYTNTLANTINGFSFHSAAMGRHTGVLAYRPKELLYFDVPVS